jgi:hypothetical protein
VTSPAGTPTTPPAGSTPPGSAPVDAGPIAPPRASASWTSLAASGFAPALGSSSKASWSAQPVTSAAASAWSMSAPTSPAPETQAPTPVTNAGSLAADPNASAQIAADEANVRAALKTLRRAMATERRPFHEASAAMNNDAAAGERLDKLVARGDVSRPDAANHLLHEHPITQAILPPFLELSRAISDGNSGALNAARNSILSELRRVVQPFRLQALLDAQPPAPAKPLSKAEDVAQNRLPALLLRGLLSGGLAQLVRSDPSNVLARWLKDSAPPPLKPTALLPAEKVLAAESRGALDAAAIPATDLGPLEGLLLGSRGLSSASAAVTRAIRSRPLDTPLAMFSPAGPGEAVSTLAPASPRELAVLADPSGAVMVRTAEGPELHHGFTSAVDGSRFYFDVAAQDGLQKVTYQSAADPDQRFVRLELEVQDPGPAAQAGRTEDDAPVDLAPALLRLTPQRDESAPEEEEEERREKKKERPRPIEESLAAVAIFDTVSPTVMRLEGLCPRPAARLTAYHLTRMNRSLPPAEAVPHLWLERAAESGLRLSDFEPRRAAAFEAELNAALRAAGADPELVGALIFVASGAATAGRLSELLPGQTRPPGTFVGKRGRAEGRGLGREPLSDPELIQDGVLLVRAGAVVVD